MRGFNNRAGLKPFRKQLRNGGTAAEATLWTCLKNRQLDGRKFRRQHSFGAHVVVDFYCPDERLVLELDGKEHDDPIGAVNDEFRENYLAANKIRVLRFENREIFEDVERVLEEIRMSFGKG